MANLGQVFNANEISPSMGFEALPEGEYTAIIDDSDMKQTKSGNGNYLALTFQVVDGAYKGRLLWENLNLDNPSTKAREIAQANLSAICHAVGMMNIQDSEELHHKPMTIKVGFDKSDNTRNRILSYKSLNGYAETKTSQSNTPPSQPVSQATQQNEPQQKSQSSATAPWGK